MLKREQKILSFKKLSHALSGSERFDISILNKVEAFRCACQKAAFTNPWFTDDFVQLAVSNIAAMIDGGQLDAWLSEYPEADKDPLKRVGVVMAGNIPMVGFHDFLCVLMSGNIFLGKLSHDDPFLLPALAEILVAIEPEFEQRILFTQDFLRDFDAVIATGSDNSSRFFEYYFGKYPHLIRHNRNGVAVLRGDEMETDFDLLSSDIFTYFGLGCRSVSLLLVPEGYDFIPMMKNFSKKDRLLSDHARYYHNYEYNRTLCLLNEEPHYDNGSLILKKSDDFRTPVSVLHYRYYKTIEEVQQLMADNNDRIQCVVSKDGFLPHSMPFGMAQSPKLSDYADGVDTMQFLMNL